ncbi:apolipoprotein N-acyltransferase [Halopseudomonas pertucinogena]|uniref:Apolipoprotein N-acyltransferase n=1 Tax=Halopseudomonas pertucinogena TaxID=86175 RepID=A0ABQ2CSY5_9GAMM|nr:apolipoprotein N-acyltransferase [Halopseudomonas pertucinogena]GGJ05901.1 apolipoprotein N-acyltransferase [Halopseudomonas pertucinogena]
MTRGTLGSCTGEMAVDQPEVGQQLMLARLLLAGLGGFMLCVPWLHPQLYWVGWVAWLPVLWALRDTGPRAALLLGWVAGTVCFAGGSYWLAGFMVNLKQISPATSVLLAALFWGYLGLSIGLACMLYRWLLLRLGGWELLAFPLSLVAVMALYPMLFKTHFADGQVNFLPALQAVELTGAAGLDAVMALFAVLLYRLVIKRAVRTGPQSVVANRLAWLLVLGWLGYGLVAVQSWDQRIQQWDTRRIGLVQPDDAITLDIPEPPPGYSREYPWEMEATERLVAAGAEWVAWPEARYKGYFDNYSVRQRYGREVARTGVPLIFHDVERRWLNAEQTSYNTVALLDGQGELAARYRKMLRMPFGEYLPEPWSWPLLRSINDRVFGEFLRPLGAGDEHVEFVLNGMRVMPMVCYEAAFNDFVAGAVDDDGAGKVLLFLSQDNWFGESSQPLQHGNMSILRGVENRLPMVHLINNGPSVATAPNGRVLARGPAFNRAELLVRVPFDSASGGSFFSRYPGAFINTVYAILAGLVLYALWRRRTDQATRPAL